MSPGEVSSIRFWSDPKKYLDPEKAGEIDDLAEWRNHTFEYKSDPLAGLWDTSKSVEEFIEDPKGDCTDFTRLTASWLVANDEPVYLLVLFKGTNGFHMVAHNGNKSYDVRRREQVENYYERAIVYREKRIY